MFQPVQDLWVDEMEEEAKALGRSEGIGRSLLDVCRARFGRLPNGIAAAAAATHDTEVLSAWLQLAATGTAAEVAAAVRAPAPTRRSRRAKAPARTLRG
jgi:hypothetical protein